MANNKIYLANINTVVTEEKLKEHFSQFGEITEIHLPVDRKTKTAKGYAFITFVEEASATQALSQDGESFLSKAITVQIAKEKPKKKKS